MNKADEATLAGELATFASAYLTLDTTTRLWSKIGAGETETAIRDLLTCQLFEEHSLPAGTAGRLMTWLFGFAGCDFEPQLRALVERATVTQRT